MITNISPKVSIVGAGPGDPELLTLKAYKAIQSANVILYDALISEEILQIAPSESIKIYVGKRNHNHAYAQEDINDMIVKYAIEYGHVVRLKGGDPFVFGRGSEELIHAQSFGIETQIIPGISSSIAVPGHVGIPVTHRGLSQSFWVITATNKYGELSSDMVKAVDTEATVVILMGLNKLHNIIDLYKNAGKYNTPVAIIQDGTLPSEKVVVGTIDSIHSIALDAKIAAPAIIVIGKVVQLYNKTTLAEISKTEIDPLLTHN